MIIVSAKDSIEDKVTGLDLGADDYLAKPFHLAELHARVKSVIRRHQTDGNTEIEIENLTVRPDDHTVFINGEELKLNRKEFDLLYYFVTNAEGDSIFSNVVKEYYTISPIKPFKVATEIVSGTKYLINYVTEDRVTLGVGDKSNSLNYCS